MQACPQTIEELRVRIESWRENPSGRSRCMPKPLWTDAVAFARVHGCRETAHQLGVNIHSLFWHMKAGKSSTPQKIHRKEENSNTRVVQVAQLNLPAGIFSECRAASAEPRPTAVLTTPNGVTLRLYESLSGGVLPALVREVLQCSR